MIKIECKNHGLFLFSVLLILSAGPVCAAEDIPLSPVEHLFDIQSGIGGSLSLPTDVAVNRNGQVYIVDSGHNRIVVTDRKGQAVNSFGSYGSQAGQFNGPVGIAIDALGQVYVADKGNHRVQVFSEKGVYLRSLQLAEKSKPVAPVDVAVDPWKSTIYVTGNNNHRVMAFEPGGKLLRQWGGEGVDKGKFRYPATLAVTSQGIIYVVDVLNTRVQAFDRNGQFIINIGKWGVLPGQLYRPKGVALDRNGNIYVGDSYMDVIQVFDGSHRFKHVLGSAGKVHRFKSVAGMAIDGNNRIYVAEMLKHRISVYQLAQ